MQLCSLFLLMLQTCGEKACHPERSEGARSPDAELLRCAQDDRPSLQMSGRRVHQAIELCENRRDMLLDKPWPCRHAFAGNASDDVDGVIDCLGVNLALWMN